jgi:hypothetical protein
MAEIRRPPRALAEAAITFLTRTLADYRAAQALATLRNWGRVRTTVTALGEYDSRAATAQSAYLRLISIDEAYCDALSVQAIRGTLANPDRFLSLLLDEHEINASSNWKKREETFSQYHGITLSKFEQWQLLSAGIQARNAIAHGLGSLTGRQRTALATQQRRLSKVRIGLLGIRLQISSEAVDECVRFSKAFVRWLDSRLA